MHFRDISGTFQGYFRDTITTTTTSDDMQCVEDLLG